MRDIDALKRAFAALEAALGPAMVLVNNAARDDRHDSQKLTPDYYDERIATNLRHMFFAIQAVAPGMIAAGKGSIINFGSNSWWQATGGMPVYSSAKAAVHGMTRSFARDLGPHRIRVNTVVPGWVMTERQEGTLGDAGGAGAASQTAVPAGSDRAGLPRSDGALPRLRRCGHVHGQQLHGGGEVDLRTAVRGRRSAHGRERGLATPLCTFLIDRDDVGDQIIDIEAENLSEPQAWRRAKQRILATHLDGRIVYHQRTVDTLGKMIRAGTIDQVMRGAARTSRPRSSLLQLNPLRALPILRVPGTGREPELERAAAPCPAARA